MTCIQSLKVCRKDLADSASSSLTKSSKGIKNLRLYNSPSSQPAGNADSRSQTKASAAGDKSSNIPLNLKTSKDEDFLRVGREAIEKRKEIGDALRVFEEIRKAREGIEKEKSELGKLSVVRRLQLKKRHLELLAREVKAEFKIIQAMENLRQEMLIPKISQDTVNKLVGRVSISGMGEPNASKVRETLLEFARMFNGRGLGDQPTTGTDAGIRLMNISSTPSSRGDGRAYAEPAIGKISTPSNAPKVAIFHELGHILESQTPSFVRFSEQWRNGRAFSAEEIGKLYPGMPTMNKEVAPGVTMPTARLVYTHPESFSDPKEVALVDKYMNAYMGKVYPGGGTEIFSVAIESFADSVGMSTLAKSHPDLFSYMVGMSLSD